MDLLAESIAPGRPRTYRTINRRAALRHDIEVAGTARARPPRDGYSWRSALVLLLLNIVVITLAMRWDGYFNWIW